MDRGKLLIVALILLAAAAGGFALWFTLRSRSFALELWGSEAGLIVRDAERVSLSRLRPLPSGDGETPHATAETGETLQVGGTRYAVTASRPIGEAPGLIKLRLALLENRAYEAGYEGGVPPSAGPPTTWRYLLRFERGDRRVSVLLDGELEQLRHHEADREAAVTPISRFLRQFVSDHLPPENPPEKSPR